MTEKIVVKQTCIEVNNYDLGDCIKLERVFSIFDMTYHTYYYKGIMYDEKRHVLTVPKGIDINWLENTLYANSSYDYSYDEYDAIDGMKLRYLPRDDTQKQAIRFMIGEGEYSENKICPSLSVNLNTGKGKTYCTIASIAFLSLKSIIITSSINWLKQWSEFAQEYTNIDKKDICFISGSPSIQKLLKTDPSKYKMYLVSHNTIKSYGDTCGWDKVGELFRYLRIGIKVYDEAHLNFDNMISIDYNTNTLRTYYVTATPKRSDSDEDRIYQLYMKNIPAIDLFDDDNDPRTKYVAFRYNSRPTMMEASSCKNQYGLDRNKYTGYVVHKENFHMMLHILMDKIRKINGKVLIYIGTNQSIVIVRDWIYQYYPDFIGDVGIYTTLTTDNKEAELDKKIILSTTKSCGAAIDIKGLKLTIVLAEPFKSPVLARQTLGRTRSENTLYFDIVDEGFFYIKKYYIAKQDIFEKYATSCREIKLDDEELINKAYASYNIYASSIHPAFISNDINAPITPAWIDPTFKDNTVL